MSKHYVCDRCGGPAYWDMFAGVPWVELHSALPKDALVVYNQRFDMCRACFELVQKFIKPNQYYGETIKAVDNV